MGQPLKGSRQMAAFQSYHVQKYHGKMLQSWNEKKAAASWRDIVLIVAFRNDTIADVMLWNVDSLFFVWGDIPTERLLRSHLTEDI